MRWAQIPGGQARERAPGHLPQFVRTYLTVATQRLHIGSPIRSGLEEDVTLAEILIQKYSELKRDERKNNSAMRKTNGIDYAFQTPKSSKSGMRLERH